MNLAYVSSPHKDYILKLAVHLGWRDNQVQVKEYKNPNSPSGYDYMIEPYEEDCGCPSLMRPADYPD